MKTAIVFYSFSGNTRAVCSWIKEAVAASGGEPETVELKLKVEERSFMGQGKAAKARLTPPLEDTGFELSRYGAFVFASPVWAFTFTPALRSFLAGLTDLERKPCACVLTCGAQLSSGNALKELSAMAGDKKGAVVFSAYISGFRSSDRRYLSQRLSGLASALHTGIQDHT